MRNSFTWKHEGTGVRESSLQRQMVLDGAFTWKLDGTGVRESGLQTGVVLGEGFIYMET